MKAMDIFYFTGDALILFATVYIGYGIFSISSEKLARVEFAWFFFILGNIAMIVGDTLFSYFSWQEADFVLTFPIHIVLGNGDFRFDDMLYLGQYLFWVLSFALFPNYLYKEDKPEPHTSESEPSEIVDEISDSNTVLEEEMSNDSDSSEENNSDIQNQDEQPEPQEPEVN